MRRRIASVLLVAFALGSVLAVGHPVSAGPQGQWTQVSDPNGSNIDEVGLQRTADGVLHLVWLRHQEGFGNEDVVHTEIAADGTLGASNDVTTDWAGVSDPDLVATTNGGLQAFFGGIRTTDSGEKNDNLSAATSDASGDSWTLSNGNIAEGGSAYASDMGAATAADGTPFQTWGASSGVWVHRGLSRSSQNYEYQGTIGGNYGYEPQLATDGSSGQMWVAWASNATDASGIWVHGVNPSSGAPVGSPMRMPGSVTDFNGEESFSQELARVPVTGRAGMPGVYVAYAGGYPSTDRVMVWKVGEAASINLALDDSGDFDDVAIASDPEGRIWVLWSRQVNYKPRIFARRSDPEVTKFGAPVSIAAPAGADSIWHMVADAQTSVVDVVASFSTPGSLAQWHIQMAPGLSTDQSTKVIKGKGKVAFGIADAGDPIEGAKISVGGKSALTDEAGEASIKLGPYPKTKTLKGTITKEGYAQRSFSVKVKT